MKDKTKGAPLSAKTYKAVLKHLKNKNKNMFRHITKAGQYFQDAMFISWTTNLYQTHRTTQNFSDFGKLKAANST